MLRRTLSATALAALVGGLAMMGPSHAADAQIRINEVQSNSALGAPDFIELINTGTTPVDISDWIVRDDNDSRNLRIPAGTVVQPGAYYVVEPESGADGFGLGKEDLARIFTPDGQLVDSYGWTEHAFSEGRLPDGTGDFVDTEPTPGAPNVARAAQETYDADSPVVVNEVMSDDPLGGEDWVELFNTGTAPVDVSGWVLRDDDDLSNLVLPSGSVIAAGGFLVIETSATDAGFGLGKADMIRLYLTDGLGLVDSYAWTDHAFSEGRLPDGTGDFVDTEPTRGAANLPRPIDSPVTINEVESNGDSRGDWVELANRDTVNTADISGWTLVDNDPSHDPIVFPAGTTIESGGYKAIFTEPDFGLGGNDAVTLRDAEGNLVASFAWESHATTTYGRCPDMTGAFATTAESTFEMANACAEVEEPVFETEAWPFGNEITEAVAPGTWGEDMSGLDIAADGTVYGVNNDNAEIFELVEKDGIFTIAASWVPTYPDGSGQPDAEGITVAGDGAIFLSTERDNKFKNVSRPSVLRVVPGADGASETTHEWNLTSLVGEIGSNAGIEAIEWIADADATRLGITDSTGAAYSPADFGDHFGGIFTVAVEQTGALMVVVLEADGTVTLLQEVTSTEAVEVVMGLDWRAGGNELWALCDELCDNRHARYVFDGGTLTLAGTYAAPTGMNPGFTNEGLAIQWCAGEPDGVPTVLWISDTPHDGVSLRRAAGDCAATSPIVDPPVTNPNKPTATDEDDLVDANRGGVQAPATARPGETITVTVPGAAGESVHVWLHSDPVLLGSPVVGANDTARVTIPTDAALGTHRLVVQDATGALIGWAELRLVAAEGGDDKDLEGNMPPTGASMSPWLLGGAAGTVLLGTTLMVMRRRLDEDVVA
ncbi:lamin tail domain-containing protein [Nocardioides sp. AE5]|uniref:lamin tail domain-containing protein n=1 Tax=Nocardioides sp. AE5 TaxID=2962573 RepID=UPI0028825291|nr:lamin tail domain-containing protein [Nocardioides sp. AE5]MDT0201060.1 lamin tail domain-containing protein [Nocardioides sp. AE5]